MPRMTRSLAALLVLSVLIPATPANAETFTGRMKANPRIYLFTPQNFGPTSITVMAEDDLPYIVLAFDSSAEITWCSSVSDERLLKCEFGGLPGDTVIVVILTLGGRQDFSMNATGPVSEAWLRVDQSVIERAESRALALQRAAMR